MSEIAERIKNIVFSDKCAEFEIMGDMQVSIAVIKLRQLDVYIYGAGEGIDGLVKWLKAEKIVVKNIVDRSPSKVGKSIAGCEIISPERMELDENCFVFVLSGFYEGLSHNNIVDVLFKSGKPIVYQLSDFDRSSIMGGNHGKYWSEYYIEHVGELVELGERIHDEESILNLLEHINCYCEYSYWTRPHIPTRYKYFWGGINGNKEDIYRHLEDEVWLNCGSHVGDTIFLYLSQGLRAKRIIAAEGDRRACERLKDNISMLQDELKNAIDIHNIIIDGDTDMDALLEGDKVTLINADIEGAELELLKTMKAVIAKDRPVISICVYHNKEDIIEIPKYIDSIVDDYEFILRKYQPTMCFGHRAHELVLYAVPRERAVL